MRFQFAGLLLFVSICASYVISPPLDRRFFNVTVKANMTESDIAVASNNVNQRSASLAVRNDTSRTPPQAATFSFALTSEVETKEHNGTRSIISDRRSVALNIITAESNNTTASKTLIQRFFELRNITHGIPLSNDYLENSNSHFLSPADSSNSTASNTLNGRSLAQGNATTGASNSTATKLQDRRSPRLDLKNGTAASKNGTGSDQNLSHRSAQLNQTAGTSGNKTVPNPRRDLVIRNALQAAPTLSHRTPMSLTETKEWKTLGCYTDTESDRTLKVSATQILKTENMKMTIDYCQTTCYNSGYRWAGVEFGVECFCGYAAPSNARMENKPPEFSGCGAYGTPCGGDRSKMCGGGDRIEIYQYVGVVPKEKGTTSTQNTTRAAEPSGNTSNSSAQSSSSNGDASSSAGSNPNQNPTTGSTSDAKSAPSPANLNRSLPDSTVAGVGALLPGGVPAPANPPAPPGPSKTPLTETTGSDKADPGAVADSTTNSSGSPSSGLNGLIALLTGLLGPLGSLTGGV